MNDDKLPPLPEPVAFIVYWGIGEKRPIYPPFRNRADAEEYASQIKSETEVRPLVTTEQMFAHSRQCAEHACAEQRERDAAICEELVGIGQKMNGNDVAADFAEAIRTADDE